MKKTMPVKSITRWRVARFLAAGFIALCVACATPPQVLPPTADTPIVLRALPLDEFTFTTHGTLEPALERSPYAQGFDEYNEELQGSLYLCAGTGPVAGPCLAVLGGLFALAGATTSLINGLAQDARGISDTATTEAQFRGLPIFATLSPRIAAGAAARLSSSNRHTMVTEAACMPTLPSAFYYTLEVAEIALEFSPGFRYRTTVVARVQRDTCAEPGESSQRLAFIGPEHTLRGGTDQAARSLQLALDEAVTALSQEVSLYLSGQRKNTPP